MAEDEDNRKLTEVVVRLIPGLSVERVRSMSVMLLRSASVEADFSS